MVRMRNFLFFSILVSGLFSIIFVNFTVYDDGFEIMLDNSGPYIGAEFPKNLGFTGEGIKIAVIDTGINFGHPDFFNQEETSRFLNGYDFVDNDSVPQDTNGHGTQVAGIIGADGQLKGIAPKVEIFSYRVSSDGESVPSDLIIKAINQAVEDEVDIINISLGVNMTHNKIDRAVNNAIERGVIVVAAAGNSGPDKSTIGSPASNPNAITVGATYNNRDSSMVSTLQVGETQFQVLPMLGTDIMSESITSEIVFGKYSRENDFEDINVRGKIVLAERGGEEPDEIVFFSDKEIFASKNGAKGLIVYNNQPGIFFGELIHEFVSEDYYPSIPTVSMTREEGLELKELLQEETSGTFNVFNHPDFLATFSSRGPVSPFYQKPDLVAPGVFVNTTSLKSFYNITSGTSYAAPHVSGAIALLLEKNPDFTPQEIKSILITTSDVITDQYKQEFEFDAGGAGRIDLKKAFRSDVIFEPPKLLYNLSGEDVINQQAVLIDSDESINVQKVEFSDLDNLEFDYEIDDSTLNISVKLVDNIEGTFEARAYVTSNDVVYQIPILVRVTDAAITILEDENELSFQIKRPMDWEYAKITITNSNTLEEQSVSIKPTKFEGVKVYNAGKYWVEANIKNSEGTFDVYSTYNVKTDSEESRPIVTSSELPERVFIILGIIFGIVIIVGLKYRRKTSEFEVQRL